MNIRRIIEQRLAKMDKTQYWLAAKAGVTPQAVSVFFSGRRGVRLKTLQKMLDALKLRIVEED